MKISRIWMGTYWFSKKFRLSKKLDVSRLFGHYRPYR
jgi:hypothetical protein